MNNPPPYKMPKIYIGDHESFVDVFYFHTLKRKYVRKKVRLGIRGLSKQAQKEQLEDLCQQLKKEFKARNKTLTYHPITTGSDFDDVTNIASALLFVKNSGDEDISKDRMEVLRDTASRFTKFTDAHNMYQTVRISNLTEDTIKRFRKWCKDEGTAGKTINKYLGAIQYSSEWLHRKKYIAESFNTVPYRVAQPKNETGRFPPLTHDEKTRAFSYFKEKNPYYRLFLFWQYYTCIRGAELYRIKIKNIKFIAHTVYLPWLDTKNGLSKHVQILEPLHELMIELRIDMRDGEMFLFGKGYEPSYEQYEGDQASEYWAHNRKAMEMPKEKQAYGLKHTFNVDYIENNKHNIDWEWLRRHNRHATKQQTQEYISGLTAFFLDETKSIILNYNK